MAYDKRINVINYFAPIGSTSLVWQFKIKIMAEKIG